MKNQDPFWQKSGPIAGEKNRTHVLVKKSEPISGEKSRCSLGGSSPGGYSPGYSPGLLGLNLSDGVRPNGVFFSRVREEKGGPRPGEIVFVFFVFALFLSAKRLFLILRPSDHNFLTIR